MLYSRRKRLAELAKREAAGESFWTDSFDGGFRTRLWYLWSDYYAENAYEASDFARAAILLDEGWTSLSRKSNPQADFHGFVDSCDDDQMPMAIEAMALATRESGIRTAQIFADPDLVEAAVNTILREHRISFELTGGEMVPFDSLELHTEVVMPALRLLARTDGLDAVESTYRDALAEIAASKPGDAITDAATALQEMLVALGCVGNSLGPLIKSARSKGLLGAHDVPMLDGIEKVLQWVSADRSERGDSHLASAATVDDAWLIVHVVGALIVRLAAGGRSS